MGHAGSLGTENGTPKLRLGQFRPDAQRHSTTFRRPDAQLGLLLVRRLRGTPATQIAHHAEGETHGLQGAHHELKVLLQRSLLRECLGLLRALDTRRPPCGREMAVELPGNARAAT